MMFKRLMMPILLLMCAHCSRPDERPAPVTAPAPEREAPAPRVTSATVGGEVVLWNAPGSSLGTA